ncbi:competence protein [Sporolactobacillus sp. CPB3-1]|uniref:Competence protein n=1 Tax=Sporolactobacillus mangiferae TaxID=2940498 RepID=A0ABT0M832_9BACL|nr:competence protein CoiA family protein [Sporolactobacillus mangiferae]MCL1631035.1 competence protein [Sporolactobacillus mangiferae]
MLVATTRNFKRVSLVEQIWSRDVLRRIDKHFGFYCPVCLAPVRLKTGEKRQWHFAHQPKHSCLIDNERETPVHLRGKKDLFDWCVHAGRLPQLEYYLPLLRQRPDLYLPGIDPAVIEYQCSTIPEHKLKARTHGYLSAHIKPVWLIGPEHHHRLGSAIRLTGFVSAAICRTAVSSASHPFASPYYICFYHPSAKQIYYALHLVPQSKTYFISQERSFALADCCPYQLLHPPQNFVPEHFKQSWLTMKKRKRLEVSTRLSREEHRLREQVYQLQRYFACFPPHIGLPHPSYIHFLNPPVLWQMWLYLLIGVIYSEYGLSPRQIIKITTHRGMETLFEQRCLPLCEAMDAEQLISIYLEQLVHLRVAERVGGCFRIIPHQHPWENISVSALLKEDRAVLERLESLNV